MCALSWAAARLAGDDVLLAEPSALNPARTLDPDPDAPPTPSSLLLPPPVALADRLPRPNPGIGGGRRSRTRGRSLPSGPAWAAAAGSALGRAGWRLLSRPERSPSRRRARRRRETLIEGVSLDESGGGARRGVGLRWERAGLGGSWGLTAAGGTGTLKT